MKSKVNYSGKMWISISLMIIGAAVAVIANKWPFRTALFPVSIGICVFFMALTELLLGLFGKEDASKHGPLGTQLTEADTVDPKIVFSRTVTMFAWIFGFFLMIVFLGFTIAVPLLVFLYLKVQSKEGWGLSLILTGTTLIFFYGLFVWLLETPFPEGWLIRWLGTIDIG
jgi:hypothetical protein